MRKKSASAFAWTLLLLAAFLFFAVSAAEAAATFPKQTGAVNDFARVISAQLAGQMESLSREVLEKTGTSVVVATVETIGDNDPSDYANRLYQSWGIGKKGEDKGVLIFLAVKERRVRIETGYGVEGIIPDGLAGELLDRYAIPAFKAGDYGKGLSETMAAIAAVIAKDAGASLTGSRPPPRQSRERQAETDTGIGRIVRLLLLALAVFFLIGTRQGRAMLPWLLLMLMSGGGGRRGGDGFGGFGGGGFGGFGGGSSGGGGADRGF